MSVAAAPVTDEQLRQWNDDGYTVVRRLFAPAEMAAARAEADAMSGPGLADQVAVAD